MDLASVRGRASRAGQGPAPHARQSRLCTRATSSPRNQAEGEDPLLLRVARGEEGERTPVWLMRQAGRYMAAFRKFSDRLGFRERSETADIAIELSLQPWEAFRPDGVIMFSDILTVLPALGLEFDVVKGKGPVIASPLRSAADVAGLRPLQDPAAALPFTGEVLRALRTRVGSTATVLGFIGSPWTLAGYAIEGSSSKHCQHSKAMAVQAPEVLHGLLEHLTQALIVYAHYQIASGAQVIQIFDSWAHCLTPQQFGELSLPYAEKVVQGIRATHPGVPVIFHANGGAGKAELLGQCSADVLGLDWMTDLATARRALGPRRVQGNVDPGVLLGPPAGIEAAVEACCRAGGSRGHILNLGHGVPQTTPEDSVRLFCELARGSARYRDQSTRGGGGLEPEVESLQKLREEGRAEMGLVGC